VFNCSVISISTPVFNNTKLIGLIGVHFDFSTFIKSIFEPIVGNKGITYWVYLPTDLKNVIYTNNSTISLD